MVNLRRNSLHNRFINSTSPEVSHQEDWIIEDAATGEAQGTAGIYNVDRTTLTAEWGRWVVAPGSGAFEFLFPPVLDLLPQSGQPRHARGRRGCIGCTAQVRDELVRFKEADTSLVSLLFWVGFRRAFVNYDRAARQEGKRAWTFGKKLRYSVNTDAIHTM